MVFRKEANMDNTHCLKWGGRFARHPRIKFFYCHPRSSYKKGCRLKKKSCREWVGGVLQVTGQKYVSKYVSYIERWFRIERDGLTVTWIMLPDHKCLSRNRFSKDLVNNMPLYTTAVNCVPACLNPTYIYNKCRWDNFKMVQAMCLRSDFTRAGCQDPALAINVFMHRDDSNRRQAFAFFVLLQLSTIFKMCRFDKW